MSVSQNSNHLFKEKSPYLLQHQYNPVNWYPWGNEALDRAKTEDKPILLSIGYSSCHWCHVMAHESFENENIAKIMNNFFINIKVDREERPDLDDIYMQAIIAVTGHGGWPLTVFLTPSLKPFFGGTYFPPQRRFGQPGFDEILHSVSAIFQKEREDIEKKATILLDHISPDKKFYFSQENILEENEKANSKLNPNRLFSLCEKMLAKKTELQNEIFSLADLKNGGFHKAPKFPEPAKIKTLLFSSQPAHFHHAIHTLNKMRMGGIADQLLGGFSRYSVDEKWLVPHFEKMLYDNAQLLELYAASSCLLRSNQNPDNLSLADLFEETARNIFCYLESRLKTENSLYMTAEDADSEGEEGLFYIFSPDEIETLFSDNKNLLSFVKKYFNLFGKGNFEGHSFILTIPESLDEICQMENLSLKKANEFLQEAKTRLISLRLKKIPPAKDTKVILSLNALTVTSLLRASFYLNEKKFAQRAIEALDQLLNLFVINSRPIHQLPVGSQTNTPFLDDVSFLIESLIEAFLLTQNIKYKKHILELVSYIKSHFYDPQEHKIFFALDDKNLLFRPQKLHDNVVPSPHSILFNALAKFFPIISSHVSDEKEDDFIHHYKLIEDMIMFVANDIEHSLITQPLLHSCIFHGLSFFVGKDMLSVNLNTPKSLSSHHVLDCFEIYSLVFRDLSLRKGTEFLVIQNFLSLENSEKIKETVFDLCTRMGCQSTKFLFTNETWLKELDALNDKEIPFDHVWKSK